MRVTALLAILFGFLAQMLLDGQVFTHAVFGIISGAAAIVCGLTSARTDPPHRWFGRIMAGFGLALGIWCLVMLPSAYRFQERFNHRREENRIQNRARPRTMRLEPTPGGVGSSAARFTSTGPAWLSLGG
jgi:hypothetical protein